MESFESAKSVCLRNNKRILETAASKDSETTLHLITSSQSQVSTVKSLLPKSTCVSFADFDSDSVKLYDVSKIFPVISTLDFGHVFAYSDVISSTQTIARDELAPLLEEYNYVTLGAVQTKGVGRSGNVWESILGSICVTISSQIPFERIAELHTLQYLTALAVVDTAQNLSDKRLPLRIKWPNDVVHVSESGLQKICGILFESSLCGTDVHIHGGVGINVSNSDKMVVETTDLSTIIGRQLTREEVLCTFLEILDAKLTEWKKSGFARFQHSYESSWLHSNQEVTVAGHEQIFTIAGLDRETWFLSGVGCRDGKVLTLHPDGNRFDALHGLISPKT